MTQLMVLGTKGGLQPSSTDYWKDPGEVRYGLLFFFFWRTVLLIGMFQDWPDWAKWGRKGCVFVGVLRD